eukprot:707473-Pleurochrysis_carterae.AAC.1
MREYVRQITKGNTNVVFPIAPDQNIKSYNRHRVGTHQVITTESLRRQQKNYYEYVDGNTRLTEPEKVDMYHNFNLHQSTKP